jgi:PAS domain S-box-containing protein
MQRRPNRDRKLGKARSRKVKTPKRRDASHGRRNAEEQPAYVAQLQAFLNVLPAYTWYAAPSGALIFVNKRTADYLGLPKDHPLCSGIDVGAQWDDWVPLLHPDDREKARQFWSNCLRTGEAGEQSYRVRGAQGDYRWFLTYYEPLRASDGTLLLWLGATLDIEELKCAEQALRESEAKFRDYAETASDWLWETDAEHKFTVLSENAFGSDPAPRIATTCWDHALDLETEPEKWRLVWATLDSHKPFRDFVYCAAGSGGAPMYVKASGKPVFDRHGKFRGYRGTGTDVTAMVRAQRAEASLRSVQAELAHIGRVMTMGQLTASIAHEVNQPISSARNNARAALNFLDRSRPDLGEVEEALGCIVDDTDRAGAIIDRIRDQIKKTPPRSDRFDLNGAINQVIVLARGEITNNRVSVDTHLAQGALPVQGDRVQLQQVVLNLILNAVEAMGSVQEGPRELSLSTEQTQASGFLVTVGDTGPGIDPENIERIFEAFYTSKSNGVGMGLSICRSIINAHGGRLWADLNTSGGAIFRFTLPG